MPKKNYTCPHCGMDNCGCGDDDPENPDNWCVLPPGQKGWPPMDFGAYFKSDDYRRDQAKQRAEMKKISKSSGRLVLY